MTVSAGEERSGGDPAASTAAAVGHRYPRPSADAAAVGDSGLPTAEEINAFATRLGPPGWWTLPRTLGVIGLVCSVLFNPLGVVLGAIGHYKARQRGESARLPKLAWILSLVLPVFGFAVNSCAHNFLRIEGFY